MQGGNPGCAATESCRRTGKTSSGGSEGQRTPAQRQGDDAHGQAAGAGGPADATLPPGQSRLSSQDNSGRLDPRLKPL